MLKKTITYVDYDNNPRTEDFYFNLSKAEITEMELKENGGIAKKLERIVQSQNNKEIVETFKDIVLMSYGVKSPDGKRFIKSQELRDEFSQTEAYTELFMEMVENETAAAEFINAVLPSSK